MRWLVLLALSGCAHDSIDPTPDPDPDPIPDPTPQTIETTIDGLQPGWRVTTSRLSDHDTPTEVTTISDGSPITLVGDPSHVFAATVTDAAGTLIEQHAMMSPCTKAASRQLRVPQEYATIQAAIDVAQPGETVKVAAGEYSESVKLRPGVCLLGSGAKHTVLDARGEARTLVDLTAAPGSVVSGFTMRRTVQDAGCAQPSDPFLCSGNWYHAAIYIGGETWGDPTHDAPPIITNNVFEANDTGVMFYWRSSAVLRNNVFVDNRVGFVANHYQDRTLVANNIFYNNTELAIGNQAAYLDIIDNVIVGSRTGILFQYVQTGFIRCNIFYGNGTNQDDIYLVPPRFTIGTDGNVEVEPRFVGNGDWHLHPDSPGKDHGCHGDAAREPDGTLPDIGVYGGPLAAAVDL